MNTVPPSENFDHFLPQRNSLLLRGIVLTTTGGLLTVFTVIHPGVRIMSQTASWLPLVSMVIFLTGIVACIDAYTTRHSKEFFINLNIAILDTVVGLFLLTELNKTVEKIILLSAAYLLLKGIFRVIAASVVDFPHAKSTIMGGIISIVLGMLLWQEWPIYSMWFICFCLSVDLTTRGWALIHFGVWLKAVYKVKQHTP